MKIQKFAFLTVFLLLFFCSHGQAATTHLLQSKKVYIDTQAVKVTREGIFVSTDNGLIKVKTLRSDEKGIYILERRIPLIEKGSSHRDMVTCPYCHKYLSRDQIWHHLRYNCPCRP